ncbi:MAG: peptidylprolyl isomerase [Phycisphaeraceae bacterium]
MLIRVTPAVCFVLAGLLLAPAMPSPARAATAPAAEATGVDADTDRYQLDAMVGQVNGRPIFARRVLGPIEEQLASLGRGLPEPVFREEVAGLIADQLEQLVTHALILGEAERDLSDRERQGVAHMVHQHERELIRRHGRGSRAVADTVLRDRTGRNLDQSLRDFREQIIVDRHVRTNLWPRINVTRRHIARHYEENRETYQPPAVRTLRLVVVGDATEASAVRERIDAGETFADVAADGSLNAYRAHAGGRIEVRGDQPLAHDALNAAMRALEVGEHVGPIEAGGSYWFVSLENIEQAPGRSLRDVQLEIAARLERQQFDRLSRRYRDALYEAGSYNSIPEMAHALLEIAVVRHAAESPQSRG